jgi:hypothetical protein
LQEEEGRAAENVKKVHWDSQVMATGREIAELDVIIVTRRTNLALL